MATPIRRAQRLARLSRGLAGLARSLPILMLLAGASAAAGQQVTGRVVDDPNRRGVAGAEVSLVASAGGQHAQAVTDREGFFVLRAPGPGDFRIIVIHPGYYRDERDVRVAGDLTRLPAFVQTADVVALEAITAAARRSAIEHATAGTFSRPSHIISGERMANLERVGASPTSAVLQFTGIRVRETRDGRGRSVLCVESTRAMVGLGAARSGLWSCNWLTIVLDGMTVQDPEPFFRTLNMQHFESIEYLPPGGAGFRYGMDAGASGALAL
jgi:hypothetical protein